MIHKSSVIDTKAKISKNVKIGPFCYIGPNVILEDNVELISNVHIEGNTKVGKGTKVFPFASIGTQPQDLKFKGEKNSLEIGKDNLIREYVTIEDSVVIGGNSAVQQFTRIGRLAMIGGMTGVLKDVIPFGLSIGNRNYLDGINLIGLRRKKYENQKIMGLNKAYKEIFASKNLHENLNKINGEHKDNELVNEVITFIEKDKKRPICSPKS